MRLSLALAALGAGACGGGDDGSTETSPTTAATATTMTTASTTTTSEVDGEAAEGEGESAGAGDTGDDRPAAAATAEDAIRAVLTADGGPQQACTTFVTEDLIEAAYGGRANCLAARRPSALAGSLRIVAEGGGSFTAVPSGGSYDGVELEIEVVDEDGFRVSSLLADVPAGP